jgi:hypothetical protein
VDIWRASERERRGEESAPCTTATSSSSFTSWFTHSLTQSSSTATTITTTTLSHSLMHFARRVTLNEEKDHVFHFFFTLRSHNITHTLSQKIFLSLSFSLSLSATIIHSTFDCVVSVVVVSAERFLVIFGFQWQQQKKAKREIHQKKQK